MGNRVAMPVTSSLTRAIPGSSLMSESTWRILAPMNRISGSFMRREVTAGVPMRRPLVTKGLRVSLGMVFLFTVMPAQPRAFSASRPVIPLSERSMRRRWLSVPPDTSRSPPSMRTWARSLQFFTICRL